MAIHWGGKGPGHVSRWPKAVGPVNTYSGATMLLDFLNSVLDPRITFSRGTGATRVNASGFIETVGNTTPRFDYDPVTLAPRGLLIEEARTNLLLRSEEFDNASWSKNNSTVTANATQSPDGTVNADKLNETATTAFFNVAQTPTLAISTTYTLSCYMKAAERGFGVLNIFTGAASCWTWYNLTTGVVSTLGAGATATITPAGNGWYRCTLTIATAATGSPNIAIFPAATNGVLSYAGTAGSGIYLYGAQLEAGSFATSYIPTVASTVTRNADVATMTGTNFSSWYNQSEGTFVSDWSAIGHSGSNVIIGVSDSGLTNQFQQALPSATTARFLVRTSGVDQATLDSTSGATSINKMGSAYKVNDFASTVNGATVVTDAAGTLPVVDRMGIGSRLSGLIWNGHIRTIAYFNTRLPNAQLQTLTAPSLATTLSLDFTSGSYNVGF